MHFIGATLWTDFRLDGAGSEPWAHRDVGENLADFTGAVRDRTAEGGLLTTHETARRHAGDRAFIEAELSKARDAGLAAVVIIPPRSGLTVRPAGSWSSSASNKRPFLDIGSR